MDEKDFKKHLQDLAHGHHHPEEHDWDTPRAAPAKRAPVKKKPAGSRPARARRTRQS
jgi:hypothetical protein